MPNPNRWITTTLTVLSATLLLADAAPLPQSSADNDNTMQRHLDASTASSSSASMSYTRAPTKNGSAYSTDSVSLFAEDQDDDYPIAGSQWESDAQSIDLSSFAISNFSVGLQNLQVMTGSPSPLAERGGKLTRSVSNDWDPSVNSLRVTYPAGSMNPGNNPRGGSTFYANPIDMRRVHNATLEYSVFFPGDFDFVKGGKLPGLYGGHSSCTGGVDARDCFSTRMMWRENGHGELYLYAPRHRQTQRLCRSPPFSDCSRPYGMSIGRGSWSFARGTWTDIRQDVWLNTPGKNDGGFNIWINGQLVVHADDVFYRDITDTCLASIVNSGALQSDTTPSKRDATSDDENTFITEDWLSITSDINNDDKGLQIRSVGETEMAPLSQESSVLKMVKRWLGVGEKAKRTPYDDGHWRGIHGYPGDPGYTGGYPETSTTMKCNMPMTTSKPSKPSKKPSKPSTPKTVGKPKKTSPKKPGTLSTLSTFSLPNAPDFAIAAADDAEDPPAEDPPTDDPPAEDTPPADDPPVEDPPAEEPPADDPPAEEPPAADPPAAELPTDDPPKPPAPDFPAAQPAPAPPSPPEPAPSAPEPAPAPTPPPPPPPPAPTPSTPAEAPNTSMPLPHHVDPFALPHHRHASNIACERGFVGLFFSTFFGGHTEEWASPREQNTYFRNFRIRINS